MVASLRSEKKKQVEEKEEEDEEMAKVQRCLQYMCMEGEVM